MAESVLRCLRWGLLSVSLTNAGDTHFAGAGIALRTTAPRESSQLTLLALHPAPTALFSSASAKSRHSSEEEAEASAASRLPSVSLGACVGRHERRASPAEPFAPSCAQTYLLSGHCPLPLSPTVIPRLPELSLTC